MLPRPPGATVFCAGPDAGYDPAPVDVPVDDPSHTGPALTVLRAKVCDDHELEETVRASYSDSEVIRSAVELALLMVAARSNVEIAFPEGVPISVRRTVNQIADVAHHHRQVSFLLTVAQQVEQVAADHRASCRSCRSLLEDAPLLIRGRFMRDLADGLAIGGTKPFTIRGLPAAAAVDACWFLLQVTETDLRVSGRTQLEALGEALLDSMAGLSGAGESSG